MFGRRGPTRIPAWQRILVALFVIPFGSLVLGGITGAFGERAEGTPLVAFVIAGAIAAALIGGGLLLLIGVIFGVGDYGERPAEMKTRTRLFLDFFGYVFSAAFVAAFALIGLTPALDWGGGVGAVIARTLFTGFAVLVGAAMVVSIFRAITRAVRSEPYDDGSPTPPQE
jgi:hypothetical protein